LRTRPGNVVPVSDLQTHVVPACADTSTEQDPLSVTQNDDGVPRSGDSGEYGAGSGGSDGLTQYGGHGRGQDVNGSIDCAYVKVGIQSGIDNPIIARYFYSLNGVFPLREILRLTAF
jgi:hypothetical protein